MMAPLLDIADLTVGIGAARILDDVSLDVAPGELVGVVGESGCGKSTLLRAILGILPRRAALPRGKIRFEGRDILSDRAAGARSRIGFIPQDPYLSLNPVFRVGDQILEIMRRHAPGDRAAHRARLVDLLRAVQLPDAPAALAKYPHQFSGGQRQRLLIAAALSCDPALILADEPTTALDVTTQREILGLLRDLARERGLAMLFVTHDFGVLASLCHRVVVLYAGRIAEMGPTRDVLDAPAHPYTRLLLACHPDRGTQLAGIPGAVPPADAHPAGCRFHPRCPAARDDCTRHAPPPQLIAPGRSVACPHHAAPLPVLAVA